LRDARDTITMTDTVPLSVKWNKESFNVDFVIAGGVKGLKTELEEKTGVPADRMKLMAKSKGEFCVVCDSFNQEAIDFYTESSHCIVLFTQVCGKECSRTTWIYAALTFLVQ
jgi:hypothetical protein